LAQEPAIAAVAARERQGGEQTRHAVVEDGQILAAGLVAERAGEPAFADPAWPGDQEVAPGPDPAAGSELEERGTVEPAMRVVVDILDAGGVTKARRAGAGLEALLAAQRHLVLEQQAKPLGVLERACLGVGIDLLVALGHAVQAEGVEEVERRMGEHGDLRQWK
jgi:hypothetical protein